MNTETTQPPQEEKPPATLQELVDRRHALRLEQANNEQAEYQAQQHKDALTPGTDGAKNYTDSLTAHAQSVARTERYEAAPTQEPELLARYRQLQTLERNVDNTDPALRDPNEAIERQADLQNDATTQGREVDKSKDVQEFDKARNELETFLKAEGVKLPGDTSPEPSKSKEPSLDEIQRAVETDTPVMNTETGAALAAKYGISVEELDRRLRTLDEEAEAKGEQTVSPSTIADRAGVAAGAKSESALQEEERKRHQEDLRKEVEKQFLHADGKFYYRDNPGKLAMEDRGDKLVTAEQDSRSAATIAKLAESKGWQSIKVSGTEEFRRNVWMEAAARGLVVTGYKPSKTDELLMEQKREQTLKNGVTPERIQNPTTAQLEAERKLKQQREDYNIHRPQPPVFTGQSKIVQAVATAVVADKIKDPGTRDRVMNEVTRHLQSQEAKGKAIPTVQKFDPAAPPQRSGEVARPAIERSSERSR